MDAPAAGRKPGARAGHGDGTSRTIELWQNAFPTVAATPTALNRAIRIVDDFRLQFWDALLVATVAEKGVAVPFSEDMRDGRVVNGVRIVNPFGS